MPSRGARHTGDTGLACGWHGIRDSPFILSQGSEAGVAQPWLQQLPMPTFPMGRPCSRVPWLWGIHLTSKPITPVPRVHVRVPGVLPGWHWTLGNSSHCGSGALSCLLGVFRAGLLPPSLSWLCCECGTVSHHVPPCLSWRYLTWLLLNLICVPTMEQHQGNTLVAIGLISQWVEPPAMAAGLSMAHSS